MSKEEWMTAYVYEQTHQVEEECALQVGPHCVNNGTGYTTLRVQTWCRGTLINSFIGDDAISFLREIKTTLEHHR
jgi:hypothetical protein